jgi:type II secretory pathway pseudopilin PulG
MSNLNKHPISQQASTLVEVLVAVTIIALVLTAVSAMISMSIKLANSNEQNQLALQKAQEGLEFFRKERLINSWYSFSTPLTDGATYCLSSIPEETASISAQLGVCGEADVLEAAKYNFKREVTVNYNGANSLTVQVDLNWTDGNKDKNLNLEQSFDNY